MVRRSPPPINFTGFKLTLSFTHRDIVYNKGAGKMAGGLFNVKIHGSGLVAIATHGKPQVMQVNASCPAYTDPNATVSVLFWNYCQQHW